MDLIQLKKNIPYKWRVQSFSKNKQMASCVAYIDARDVMDLLDEVCGEGGWQDDYRIINDQMFAGIGIKVGNEWVWKWDTGTESQTEKEKGVVSDSFKRAAVKWGIGRFLYSIPITYVDSTGIKSDSDSINGDKVYKKYPQPFDKATGKIIYDLTSFINSQKK